MRNLYKHSLNPICNIGYFYDTKVINYIFLFTLKGEHLINSIYSKLYPRGVERLIVNDIKTRYGIILYEKII